MSTLTGFEKIETHRGVENNICVVVVVVVVCVCVCVCVCVWHYKTTCTVSQEVLATRQRTNIYGTMSMGKKSKSGRKKTKQKLRQERSDCAREQKIALYKSDQ